jgi:hypothetical protein
MVYMKRAILINSSDNVATVLDDVVKGDKVSIMSPAGEAVKVINARQAIPNRHKIAIQDIRKDTEVVKYGEAIGVAKNVINKGGYVHIYNVSERVRR